MNNSYSTLHTYLTSHHNKNKIRKTEPAKVVPVRFIDLKVKREKDTYVTFKALLDSGASFTLATEAVVRHLKKTKDDVTSFKTAMGTFFTNQKCRTKMIFAEFNPTAEIMHTVHVAKSLGNYNLIIGQDLLHKLEIDIKFSTKTMCWNNVKINMKEPTCTIEDLFHVEEELFVTNETDCIAKILDAKYQPANLKELTANLPYLTADQQQQLYDCLNKRSSLLNGTLGLWKGEPYKIELRDGAQPYHARPYGVPQAYEQTVRHEVEQLCNVGVLRK